MWNKELQNWKKKKKKFDWIWPAGSGEEDFFKKSVYFYCFAIISPWRGTIPFIWTNLNPLPQNDLCQVWLDLAQWFWRRRILNAPIPFLHFCDYLPLEEDLALYLNKPEFPLLKKKLYQVCQLILEQMVFKDLFPI